MGIDPKEYCNAAIARYPPGLLCCSPDSTIDNKVRFRLFESSGYASNLTWDEVNSDEAKRRGSRYPDIVIVAHAFLESVSPKNQMYDVKDGYLKRGASAVVIVDWDQGNRFPETLLTISKLLPMPAQSV